MKRFAAKLLFQYRVSIQGDSGKRRLCEERILVIEETGARKALSAAKRSGKKSEFSFTNDEGNPVRFEFIGVMDLLELGLECSPNEVWYDLVERLTPMERKKQLIPLETELSAIKHQPRKKER